MSEYADRLARVRAVMADRGLGALIVNDPANLFYLTGYDAWSFYTPQCLLIPADGEVQLFARAMEARIFEIFSSSCSSHGFGTRTSR